MEANRDDAFDCLRIARDALRNQDVEKARRLARKSMRLYPTPSCEEFLQQLAAKATGNNEESKEEFTPSATNQERANNDESSKNLNYTPEQKAAVERLLHCKDYYKLIGVSKEFTEAELKKKYKKLALQFHPDKNSAPKADEAFKAIGKAYDVLSDPEKRRQYDLYGEEGLGNRVHRHSYQYTSGFEFELFRQMFGTDPWEDDGGFAFYRTYSSRGNPMYSMYQRPSYHRHQHQHHHQEPTLPPVFMLFFTIPLLLLVVSFLFSSPSPYSFSKSGAYTVERKVEKHDIIYYVTPTFNTDYPSPGQKQQVEKQVIGAYIERLNDQCSYDLWTRRRKQSLPKSCERLEKITGMKIRA